MKNIERIDRPKNNNSSPEDYVTLRPAPRSLDKGKGQYVVRVQFRGKRTRYYFKSKDEAEEFYKFKKEEVLNHSSNYRKGDISYHTLGNIFHEVYKDKLDKGKIKKSTYVYLQGIFKSHLQKYENLYTHQVTGEIWKDITQECLRRDCPSQPEKVLGILNNIQRYLLKKDYNPLDIELDDISASYKNKAKPKSSYTMEEYEKIYLLLQKKGSLSKQEWIGANILVFGMNTGLRIGEIISLLHSKDIDLENQSVTVRTTYSSFLREITTPKTQSSYRTVTFNEDAHEAVLNLIEHAADQNSEFLVTGFQAKRSSYSKPLGYGACVGYLKSAMRAAGVAILNSQAGMRKTHITNLIRNAEKEGVPFIEAVTVAQKRAGHSKLTTTLDDYTKTSTEKEERLIKSLSRSRKAESIEVDLNNLSKEDLIKIIQLRK